MAGHEPSSTPFRLTIAELDSLVQRLRARAVSAFFPDQPLLKTDLALSAEIIRTFVKTYMKAGDTLDISNANGAQS